MHPLADLGVLGVLATSKIFAMRPMKVTARGPGYRSLISHSRYSTCGCHGWTGLGFRASSISSDVKPSPMRVSEVGVLDEAAAAFVGEDCGVSGKNAWIEASPLPDPPISMIDLATVCNMSRTKVDVPKVKKWQKTKRDEVWTHRRL